MPAPRSARTEVGSGVDSGSWLRVAIDRSRLPTSLVGLGYNLICKVGYAMKQKTKMIDDVKQAVSR